LRKFQDGDISRGKEEMIGQTVTRCKILEQTSSIQRIIRAGQKELKIILNWFEELKKEVPVD
jgi:hypothetical protein